MTDNTTAAPDNEKKKAIEVLCLLKCTHRKAGLTEKHSQSQCTV